MILIIWICAVMLITAAILVVFAGICKFIIHVQEVNREEWKRRQWQNDLANMTAEEYQEYVTRIMIDYKSPY